MAQREIRIPIVGDSSQLRRELDLAERQLQGFGQGAGKTAEKFNREFLAIGVGVTAGFVMMTKSAMDFEAELSGVGAMGEEYASSLDALRESALKAGQATVYSATEAAQAQSELAKAGVSAQDILGGGLKGALDLAAAGNLGLADAAGYAAQAMTTFKLSGGDVPRIADALAAGANKSAADIDDMGLALSQAGLVADQTGLSLEDTVGVLAMFAQAGLKGSDAGTSLKTALLRLTPSTEEASDEMEALGLKFYDAEGSFIGISAASELLKQKLGQLSPEQRNMALQTIFGTDAIRAATILMQEGASGVDGWTQSVSDSGYASELAAKKTDNLKGDLEQLRGALETALIQGGSQATTALRGLTSGLTSVVTGLGEMPAPIQTAFLGATGLIGVGSTAIGVYGTLKPKIDDFKAALEGMGGIGPSVARNLGTIGLAAGGLTLALTGVAYVMGEQAAQQAKLEAAAEGFAAAMKEAGGATDGFNKSIRQAFADSNIGELLKDIDADLDVLTDGVRNSGTELDRWADLIRSGSTGIGLFVDELESAADGGNAFAQELLNLKGAMSEGDFAELVRGLDFMNDAVDTGSERLAIQNQFVGELGSSSEDTAGDISQLADEQLEAARAADEHAAALEKQNEAILALAGGDVAFRSAQIQTREALDEFNESMKDGTLSANDREQAGLDLIDAFLSESEAAVSLASDMKEAAGSQLSASEAAGIQKAALERLRDTLAPGNPLRAQLQAYIDKLGEIPPEKPTNIVANTEDAKRKLNDLLNLLRTVGLGTTVTVNGKIGTVYGPGVGNAVPESLYNYGGNAFGGSVDAGVPGWVGERGKELFVPKVDGQILNASESNRMMSAGAGSAPVIHIANITLPNVVDGPSLLNELQKLAKVNGPLNIPIARSAVAA